MDAQLRHITTTPNELCARLHNRLPVILKPEAWPVWRAEAAEAPQALQRFLSHRRSFADAEARCT
jgi:putative SOS response-associated peptidase YedK